MYQLCNTSVSNSDSAKTSPNLTLPKSLPVSPHHRPSLATSQSSIPTLLYSSGHLSPGLGAPPSPGPGAQAALEDLSQLCCVPEALEHWVASSGTEQLFSDRTGPVYLQRSKYQGQ